MVPNQYTKRNNLSKDRRCPVCHKEARRLYEDKLCGKCYIKKKRIERQITRDIGHLDE